MNFGFRAAVLTMAAAFLIFLFIFPVQIHSTSVGSVMSSYFSQENWWGLVTSSSPAPICASSQNNSLCCYQCMGTSSSKCQSGPIITDSIPISVTLYKQATTNSAVQTRYARFCVRIDEFAQISVNQCKKTHTHTYIHAHAHKGLIKS